MRRKLFLSTFAIILVTLILSLLSVNFVFKHQFTDYVAKTTEDSLAQLPNRLSSVYTQHGNWDTLSLYEISHDLPVGAEITLKDTQGKIITALTNPMDEMMKKSMMGMGMSYSVNNWKTQTLTIKGPQDNILATADVRYPSDAQILDPKDLSFVTAVFRSLLLAGALALVLGLLLSLWTSNQLVKPLRNLTQAVKRVGKGHLDEKVLISSQDEVGELAQAFNSMANDLKSQEMLRKQFTADIAHELRTPLTSLRSYIEAFQDGVLPPDQENLAALSEEIDRLVSLSSDLKDLNIAEIGKLQAQSQSVDLTSVLEKVIRNLSPLIQKKGIELTTQLPSEPVTLIADERLLTRLFYNLIHNAYKYTGEKGKIKIELFVRPNSADINVSDTGIGISENELPFIFERFYRAEKSRARETGGTGIGLALVKQILLLHKGTIDVQSGVGKGTTFKLTLPLKTETQTL
ncbi:sensor histidine kinase [Desulfitobacterium metallireducens]|uniref:histidine kinase n=1 Tax=Desulfitobacterium metallireducens DSM 15288 TaxID=871968 RepID=W0E9S5_9FIRM|nr:ATP-binding protein [Desulfitobacterium metallireducens]AHF05979.1 histidine kinase [Desulfitobacterium metallireducens DSM 15288]